jgi:hypothetical protein
VDDAFLESSRAKLGRASHHQERLLGLIDEYLRTLLGGGLGVDLSNVADEHGRWSVATVRSIPPFDGTELSLVAGDFVHNLRTALDHLACACVRASGNEPTDQNAFPIYERIPEGRSRQNFEAKLTGMDPIYAEGITALQPYRNPGTEESRNLARLASLDNLDKHKLLVPVATTSGPDPSGFKGYTVGPQHKAPLPTLYNPGVPLAPGVELLRSLLPRSTGQVHYGGAPVQIEMRFGGPDIGLEELEAIRSYVVGVVESFGPSFDS